jgi:outer membrane protein insertion porin family
VEADRQKILEYYRGKGYSEVDVRTSVDSDEKEGKARVTFRVIEGGKLEVRSVRFEGNEMVAERELKQAVKTKPRYLISFLTKTGRLDRDQLEQDVISVR